MKLRRFDDYEIDRSGGQIHFFIKYRDKWSGGVPLNAGTNDNIEVFRAVGQPNRYYVYNENTRMPYAGVEAFDRKGFELYPVDSVLLQNDWELELYLGRRWEDRTALTNAKKIIDGTYTMNPRKRRKNPKPPPFAGTCSPVDLISSKNPWQKKPWGYLGYGAMKNFEIAENADARMSGGKWRLQSPTGYGRWKTHGNGTLAEMKQLAKQIRSKPKRKASKLGGIDLGFTPRKRKNGRQYDHSEYIEFLYDIPSSKVPKRAKKAFEREIDRIVARLPYNRQADDEIYYLALGSLAGHGVGLWEGREAWHKKLEEEIKYDLRATNKLSNAFSNLEIAIENRR